jgi:hypothetical protein
MLQILMLSGSKSSLSRKLVVQLNKDVIPKVTDEWTGLQHHRGLTGLVSGGCIPDSLSEPFYVFIQAFQINRWETTSYYFNCCFTVHFDKLKTFLPTNALFIKT